MAKIPAFVCIYGPPKLGKTTDVIASFPYGTFIAEPAALKPASWLGVELKRDQIIPLGTLTDIIAWLRNRTTAHRDALVVDDFTMVMDRTVAVAKSGGYELWGTIRKQLIGLRDIARQTGVHIIFTAHEKGPSEYHNSNLRGGPCLPGQMVEGFPAACDLVLRAVVKPEEDTRIGWGGCYRCNVNDSTWIHGDRHGITPDYCPMNLAEILRAAGYELKRCAVADVAWFEPVVEKLSNRLVAIKEIDALKEEAKKAITIVRSKYSPSEKQLFHLLRDTFDRTYIKKGRQSKTSELFGGVL